MISPRSNPLTGNDPYEQLIAQTIQIERQPQRELKSERGEQKRLKGVLKDFDSELSALHGQLESLTDTVSNPFESRAATTTGSTDAFSVSGSDAASIGSHTLKVDRLASADGRISKQYTTDGTALRDFFDANGAQTFSIGVATPTDANPEARTDVSVTVDPTGTTDGEILGDVRTAIDDAMAGAVDDGTITAEQRASVSVVNETSTTARLSMRSAQTGFGGRLTFTDSGNGLLAELEANANTVASGTGGGQITEVGTSETNSKLNSQFTLDGLTLYRDSNRVTDALEGVTLSLESVSDTASSFEVAPDSKGMKREVQSFINTYNGVLEFIERKARVDGETGERGDFAGERAFTGLRFDMRNDAIRSVSGLPEDTNSLGDIGIVMGEDGTLSLDDEEALLAAAEENPSAVQDLFASDDGVATRLKERVDGFVKTGGVIETRQEGIENGIDRLNDRIEGIDERLSRREEQLRQRFNRIKEAISAVQGQQQALGLFGPGI
jgi:flagellar hook-associated protein 2